LLAESREIERWHLRGVPNGPGLDEWTDILATTHLGFDIRATRRTPTKFNGAVSRRCFGGLALVDCASSPWLGRHSKSLTGGESEAIFGFQSVRKGVELVRESGREVTLTAGDIVLWDGWQPTEVEVVEPFLKRTLIFPRERVLSVCPRLAEAEALPPLGQSPPARLLARFVDALAMELPELDDAAGAAAADAALELLRGAVEPTVPTARAAKRQALRTDVRRYVRARLQDPTLCPESIAREHAISVRALHALFEDSGESVAGLVRRERLQRCLEDLERPSGGSVTEIAFRWGFRDAAHFSRVFKREFGGTPSEARHEALARIGKESGAAALDSGERLV
jgi:AraC family transcriptional regulator, positive regulator of tynA and feaB